ASTTTARVQYQTPSRIAYVSQTAFEPAHGQRTPAPLQQHQASHGSFHHRTTPGTLQYHQAVPGALYYQYTNPEPLHHHQTTPRHHTYSSPHGGPVASPTVSSNPTDHYSSIWSSTSATSHAASSNISVTPVQVKSHMVKEVYNVVEVYLKADVDPARIKAKKLIEEEDLQSSPEWRCLYLTLPLDQLPSDEDCENLAPPRLKIFTIVPYRKVLHTSTSDTSVEPVTELATEPPTEQLTPMNQDVAVHHLMRLIAVEGVPFSAATSKTLMALCQLLNPRFEFPSTVTLKSKLRQAVQRRQRQTVNYIYANVGREAITADAWTSSHNKRKYLGITFYYMTRDCRLSFVVIGMERIAAAKVAAEILAAAIRKNGLLPVGIATLAGNAPPISGALLTDNARFSNGASFADNVPPPNGTSLPDDACPASDVRPVNGAVLSNGTTSADGAPPLTVDPPPTSTPPPTVASLPTGAPPTDGAPAKVALSIGMPQSMDDDLFFLTANATRWNSKFHMVERV
ncbi:hypothetical protein BGZ88_004522, partial [Linnemannia elongata]